MFWKKASNRKETQRQETITDNDVESLRFLGSFSSTIFELNLWTNQRGAVKMNGRTDEELEDGFLTKIAEYFEIIKQLKL